MLCRYSRRLTKINKKSRPIFMSNGGHTTEQSIGVGKFRSTSRGLIICHDLKASSPSEQNFCHPVLPVVPIFC